MCVATPLVIAYFVTVVQCQTCLNLRDKSPISVFEIAFTPRNQFFPNFPNKVFSSVLFARSGRHTTVCLSLVTIVGYLGRCRKRCRETHRNASARTETEESKRTEIASSGNLNALGCIFTTRMCR